MKFAIQILFFITFPFIGKSQFSYSDNCKKANNAIFNFEFNKALDIIKQEIQNHPNNYIAYYLENYADFFITVINGSENKYKSYKTDFSNRVDKIKKADKSDPFYKYVLSEMYLQTTLLNGQFQEFFSAGLNFYRSYKLTEENINQHPDFIYNKKIKGLHELVISIIPEKYENIFSFLGFHGTFERGMAYLDDYYAYSKPINYLNIEGTMYKFFAISQFGKDDQTPLNFILEEKYDTSDNVVLNLCHILATKQSGNTDKTLKLIKSKNIEERCNSIPHLYYLIGSLKFTRLDDDANVYFENFLNYYNGDHLIKHTHRKLALYYYLQGNLDKYELHHNQVFSKGVDLIEFDIQAEYEMSDTIKPNKLLIKAKLLYDGGYYSQAKQILADNAISIKDSPLKHQVELFYWLGKIYKSQGNYEKAKKNLHNALKYGKSISKYYFVADAALNLGMIFEIEKNYVEAKKNYNYCIDINKKSVYARFERRAKAGLKRIDNITRAD